MSREILFRGKRTDNREWVEGDLLHRTWSDGETRSYIFSGNFNQGGIGDVKVDPSTVCQYTGLTDKTGKKIFENDILEATSEGSYPIPYHEIFREIILWNDRDKCFCMLEENSETLVPLSECALDDVRIIGNFFDNPELLEGGTGEDD